MKNSHLAQNITPVTSGDINARRTLRLSVIAINTVFLQGDRRMKKTPFLLG